MNDNVRILRSNRKTVSLQILPDETLLVRAPLRFGTADLEVLLHEKSGWISEQLLRVHAENEQLRQLPPFPEAELRAMAQQALTVIPARVRYFAPLVGVTYGSITIRNQTTRWGSCSAAGNLSFNCLLMQTPPAVLDSVIVHELCHRRELNHSARFYAEVRRVMPDYDKHHAWLRANGRLLLRRMTG